MANKQKPHGTRTNPNRGKKKTVSVHDALDATIDTPSDKRHVLVETPARTKKNHDEDKTPILKNKSVEVFEMEDANETVTSSEKPFESNSTYKAALLVAPVHRMLLSTCLLHKYLLDDKNTQSITLSDDETVEHENPISPLKFQSSIRMTMMFKLPD